jgi:hypothetical protein
MLDLDIECIRDNDDDTDAELVPETLIFPETLTAVVDVADCDELDEACADADEDAEMLGDPDEELESLELIEGGAESDMDADTVVLTVDVR